MNFKNFIITIKIALEGLSTNKGRTILTTTGIVIGIATIVIVLSAARALEAFIIQEVESFGGDTIEIEIKIPYVSDIEMASSFIGGAEVTTLKVEDFEAVKKLPNVKEYYAGILGQFRSVYKNKSKRATVFATSAGIIDIDKEFTIKQGRFFNQQEDDSQSRVVVLGTDVKNDLFGTEDPIGKTIKINQVNFKVIGLLEPRGTSFTFNWDKMVYIPLATGQKQLLGVEHVIFGFVSLVDTKRTDETVQDMLNIMRQRHNIPPGETNKEDFRVTSMREAIDIVGAVTFGISLLVLLVAGISLVVGGVGIMNIMYLSVSERTREIGLRKSIGATKKIIQNQFLYEAIIITGAGGILGIALGTIVILLISVITQLQGFDFNFGITIDAIAVGLISAITFGVIFGLSPARKAANLSPVDALRYE